MDNMFCLITNYFSFIEKIILSSENRSLDNTFARSPERGELFDPAAQLKPAKFNKP